jgi:hypothetical protein
MAPLALFALLASACSSSSGGGSSSPTSSTLSASSLAPVHGNYSPSIDPANFVQTIDNPYWPLEPGTTYSYDGVRGGTPQTDVEVVTHQTKVILGITSTVVRDTVSEHGAPAMSRSLCRSTERIAAPTRRGRTARRAVRRRR